MRSGFVAIVGLPNVGKSTLMNHLLGQKIAIVAPKPQTTRNRILGVKNLEGAQVVLVDTPGIHSPGSRGAGRVRSQLNRFMNDEAQAALQEVDSLIWVVEAPDGEAARRIVDKGYRIPPDVERLLTTIRQAGKPTVLALNKVDLLRNKQALLPVLQAFGRAAGDSTAPPRSPDAGFDTGFFRSIVPISAQNGQGTDALLAEAVATLPEGERLFPEEMITDRAERWLAAELVREQVFLLTRQEVPYGVAVTIDEFDERPARKDHPLNVMIQATVHVEKEAQKRIVVGDGGSMVREIGSRARLEIEKLLDCPVHLKLFVRVDEDWTQRTSGLRDMGYE